MILREIFFDPSQLKSSPEMIDELVKGMSRQQGHKWDNKFADDVTNHLFETEKNRGQGGLDLVALNIQRGRDHGLPGYNAYREICDVGKANDWDDLRDFMTAGDIRDLRSVYSNVDDIDLFVGGFLEQPHSDSILGPIFKCIIGDTFARLKLGDRFFYDLAESGPNMDSRVQKTMRFSAAQLQEIRKTSMARILCDNTESISEMQPKVFTKIGRPPANTLLPCDSVDDIPVVNLTMFLDSPSLG